MSCVIEKFCNYKLKFFVGLMECFEKFFDYVSLVEIVIFEIFCLFDLYGFVFVEMVLIDFFWFSCCSYIFCYNVNEWID